MAYPEYYSPERIGQVYAPDVTSAVNAAAEAQLSSAFEDLKRVYLLLVDEQVDFIHADGALSVPGALEDTRRIVEWIYDHAGEITTIGASLDSHQPTQIFSPTWWQDAEGNHPAPYTVITSDEVQAGKWQPIFEIDWSKAYVDLLEENAKKQLMIWPFHTLIGTQGHTLVPALYEAIAYHSAARETQPTLLIKGTLPRTEHYSIMEPEVKVSSNPQDDINIAFMDELATYDLIYITGQAKSHCVLETVTSMMRYYPTEIIEKIRVIEDGMSSVAHPEIDFEALANETYAGFTQHGLKMVKTTDGIG